MDNVYRAHIREETGEIQTVKEHSENTARLCGEFAVPELKDAAYATGLMHDIGKYQIAFQERICGKNIRVEHSICGARAVREQYGDPLGLLMAYCIAGHHSGLPDGGFPGDSQEQSTLSGRLQRETEDFNRYKEELSLPQLDSRKFLGYLMKDCGRDVSLVVDKFAFLTRYCFSCLTDADSLDTAGFCRGEETGSLKADFQVCLEKVEKRLSSFVCETRLQKTRALLQRQVFEKAGEAAELSLMNMPTGSGKTLCSVKYALKRALQAGKRRIIYIIPFNSIIDQTAETFEKLFGDGAELLRHQSTFSYEDREDYEEDYRRAAKSAVENWDAPFIITTAVQFFESVYANKRGKLRRLHNMADSVLIFDEAHMMPVEYLQPCLRAVAYITRYLNSEAVFLTATMPDFAALMKKYARPDSEVRPLIEEDSLFSLFRKCTYWYLGEQAADSLLENAARYPSSLFVVNRRRAARELYTLCKGRKYHLSTYMTAFDRERVIREIRQELERLEKDFPDYVNVPEERRITVFSTSLIEAGVDLDFYTVFRELTGLDHILQAGGRCNREGKRGEAQTFIFELEENGKKTAQDVQADMVRGMLERYADISGQECISEYYERLFQMEKEKIGKHTITQDCGDIRSIPFREYAEKFELVSSRTVSVVVPRDEKSRELVAKLRFTGDGAARELQRYACSVYQWELNELIRQHAADDFGTGIYCLTNPDYYVEQTGILFEGKDYWID